MRYQELLRETADAGRVYHTTGGHAAYEILEQRMLKPRTYEAFVSLSKIPLPQGDIQEKDVTLVFAAAGLRGQVMEVEYTEDWAAQHPEQSSYIAGEGWQEQYEAPDDAWDEDGWEDADAAQEDFRAAEIESFLWKSDEQEVISLHPGEPVRFTPETVVGLILHTPWPEVRGDLASLGYPHVQVVGG